ncbi:MAG: tetratricopeptide repeat protein [Myxococcota bacterium]
MRALTIAALSLMISVPALLSAPSAEAAGPTKQALNKAAEALYADFGRDGVVGTQAQVQALYQEACDLGYEAACRSDRWHDEYGLADLNKAAEQFEGECSRNNPVACVVEGWAVEAESVGSNLKSSERSDRQMARLLKASEFYTTGCTTQHWAPCLELAHYSSKRASLGQDEPDQIAAFERGARDVFGWYCRRGEDRACVFGASLAPQDSALLTKKGSAAFVYNETCVNGYTPGCYELGLMLAPQKSEDENRHWFDGLCDRGHTQSCLWVGRSHNNPRDPDAVDAYRRACVLQGAEGCAIAGPALEESAPAEALQAYRLGCAMGEGGACGRLGLLLVESGEPSTALSFLDRGCESGQVDACVTAGLMRKDGKFVTADPARAMADLEMGCASPGPRRSEACFALGQVHEDGVGTVRDRAKATHFYKQACDDNNVRACFRMGEAVGGLQRSARSDELRVMAISGYVRACDEGINEACLPAAEGYATGPMSVRDDTEARRRLNELCDQGLPVIACRRQGQYLMSHADGDKDLRQARVAFARGMDLGDTESTRQLAKMYFLGIGGVRSRSRGRRFFRMACREGNGLACGGSKQPDFARP